MAFMNPRGLLTPGKPTPVRKVPEHIERPEYAWKDDVQENVGEPVIQTPETIEAMREASKIAANALALAGAAVAPGKTTDEIDGIVHDYLIEHGAYPSTLGYRGFTKSSCVSLNEIVCHGIPDTTVIQEGDIVNIDVTAYKNGVHGDTNATFFAGKVAQEHKDLVDRTYQAMMRGIKEQSRAARSTSSGALSRRTRSVSATTWSPTSPDTVWARRSTTVSSSCTMTRMPTRMFSSRG